MLSVLLVGAELLGATTLQNYGVALTVGLLSGAYSSIFIASPLLAIMKEREDKYMAIRQRLADQGRPRRSRLQRASDARLGAIAAPAARTGSAASTRRRRRPRRAERRRVVDRRRVGDVDPRSRARPRSRRGHASRRSADLRQ